MGPGTHNPTRKKGPSYSHNMITMPQDCPAKASVCLKVAFSGSVRYRDILARTAFAATKPSWLGLAIVEGTFGPHQQGTLSMLRVEEQGILLRAASDIPHFIPPSLKDTVITT